MNFKKYSEMELALLASIANLTAEDVEDISIEKGDYDAVTMEEYISVPFSIAKPNSFHSSHRRKSSFKKKEAKKNLARNLGYNLSTEDNSKKVEDILAANHMDQCYLRGSKADKKHMTIKEEIGLMEREAIEIARDTMVEEHNFILGAFADTIASMNSELESYDSTIEAWENDYKELEELLELLSEKLNDAKLKRNGIKKAIIQKVIEKDILEEVQRRERISHFGW